MALWLVRAGKYGEHEAHFLDDNVICLTWEGLEDTDLSAIADQAGVKEIVKATYPDESPRRLANWASQIGAFAVGMSVGDWVVLPRKTQSAIAVGEIAGPYRFDANADPMERHQHAVTWLNKEVPRAAFKQDLRFSFGAFLTICQITRNDAEKRVRAMPDMGWKDSAIIPDPVGPGGGGNGTADELVDLAQLASDQIAQLIRRNYAGHALAQLVAAILSSQGYTVRVSPPGPDKGVDILAAPDPLGFGSPRICVQVKSGDTPVDRPTLDQLIGVMQSVGAQQGLLVSWSGFRSSVQREASTQFFKVRLWDADALIENLLARYEQLPANIRADLPLTRIWTVAAQDAE